MARCFVFLFLAAACSDERTAPDPEEGMLRIMPTDAVLTTAPSVPLEEEFLLQRKTDGEWADLTDGTIFQIPEETFATFTDNIFHSTGYRGFHATITATKDEETVATEVTLRIVSESWDEDFPREAQNGFDGEPTTDEPLLAYPEDGVLFPPNMQALELQWWAGMHTRFRVRLHSELLELTYYRLCGGSGCSLTLSATTLDAIAATEAGGEITWEVRGIRDDGSDLGRGGPRTLLLAEQPVAGGFYYWQAEPGIIMRKEFSNDLPPEAFFSGEDAGGLCVGCHALSRSGERVAVGLNVPSPSILKVVETEDKSEVAEAPSNFASFSPDATELVRTNYDALVIQDLAATEPPFTTPLVEVGTMPDWSPDGDAIIYVEGTRFPPRIPGVPVEAMYFTDGVIKIVERGAGGFFGEPQTLLAAPGANDYYPTFSPDGEWILFNRSDGNEQSYEAPDTRIWLAPRSGEVAIELDNANSLGNLVNSWPKFAPFEHHYRGHRLLWFTFSSRRRYGTKSLMDGSGFRAQLWMAAIDLNLVESDGDPSFPAFWVPFQDLSSGNHIGQWTEEIIKE